MEKKIKVYLDGFFVRAADGEIKDEVITELYTNMCEKYNDLVSQGKSPEEAYAETIEGIGDTDEIIGFINAGTKKTKTEFDFNISFDGFENRIKELAKDIEAPLREVGNDLKKAAESALDAAKGAKEPLKNMAKQVQSEIKDAVSKMEFSQQGNNTFRYDYEVPSDGINNLEIIAESGDVTFGVSQNDNIYVVEFARQALAEDKRANIMQRGDTLTVAHGKSQVSFFFFGIGVFTSDFEIYLPKRVFDSILVRTSSGDVDLDYDLEAKEIRLNTTSGEIKGSGTRCPDLKIHTSSGDIELQSLLSQKADISTTSGDTEVGGEIFEAIFHSTSGDIDFSGSIKELNLRTTSGDVELEGNVDSIYVKSVSGDMDAHLGAVPKELTVDTVSGDIKLYIPDNDGFTLNYQRVSGEIKSDFNLMTTINSKDGSGVYRDGNLRLYNVKTISGDIKLLKR